MLIPSSFSKEKLKSLIFEYASDIIDDTYLSNIIEDDEMMCVYHNMSSHFHTINEDTSFIFYKNTTVVKIIRSSQLVIS